MSIRQLFTAIFYVMIFGLFVRNTLDPDLWWHLKTGEYVIENGIPSTDPDFSYTAGDNEWFMHEWLSEVLMYLVYDVVGLVGLSIFFTMIFAGAFYLYYHILPGKPYTAGFILAYSAGLSTSIFNARPQVFNLFLAIIFSVLLEGFRTKRLSRRWLWVMVPASLLWANLHSGFLLGFVILGVYVVGGGLQLLLAKHTLGEHDFDWPALRFLGIIGLVSGMATLINPRTYRQWLYPFETTLFSDAMQTLISEWHSPDFKEPLGMMFAGYLFFGCIVFIYSKAAVTWTDLLLFFGSALGGLQQQRNIAIFGVVVVPVVVKHTLAATQKTRLGALLSGNKPEVRISRRLGIVNLVILILISLFIVGRIIGVWQENEAAIRQEFPESAVAYIKAENLDEQRIYNRYNWGGYLIWHNIPTFIDGRADLFGDEFIYEAVRPFFLAKDWQEVLDKYAVDYILIANGDTLEVLLDLSPGWELAYEDDIAVIYTRAGPAVEADAGSSN
jgi:hypothetical protein